MIIPETKLILIKSSYFYKDDAMGISYKMSLHPREVFYPETLFSESKIEMAQAISSLYFNPMPTPILTHTIANHIYFKYVSQVLKNE